MQQYLFGLLTLIFITPATAKERYLHYTCAAYSKTSQQLLLRQFHIGQTTDKSVLQLRYHVVAQGEDPNAQESLRDFQFRSKAQTASVNSLNSTIHKDGTVGRWIDYDKSIHEIKKVSTPTHGFIQIKKTNKSLTGTAILPAFNNNQEVLVKCSVENTPSEGGETCTLFFCL